MMTLLPPGVYHDHPILNAPDCMVHYEIWEEPEDGENIMLKKVHDCFLEEAIFQVNRDKRFLALYEVSTFNMGETHIELIHSNF